MKSLLLAGNRLVKLDPVDHVNGLQVPINTPPRNLNMFPPYLHRLEVL
jgi:hypothetical protein